MEKVLTRTNRISAYILIALVLFLLITGYRQVGYFTFFGRGLANSLHQIYLNIAGLVVGAVHVLLSVRRALIRNQIKGVYINIILALIGITVVGGFSYFTFF
jgi:ABC-type sulfate transport system permease subunit